ncbi:MAG: response regulator transcription factor [Ktedonobacteraceae bacterium]
MAHSILIAEAREILRVGLRAIVVHDPLIDNIYEASTSEQLLNQLSIHTPDLVVIHQSLITDIMLLPRGRFIILADQPDKNILLAACALGARGYFLENVSAELLHMAMRLSGRMFLLDPILTPWLFDCISGDILPTTTSKILTTREKEIFNLLLNSSLTNRAIGERLCISEATVKTHLAHIFRKLNIKRRPMKAFHVTSSEFSEQYKFTSSNNGLQLALQSNR